jgi:hypothetical protein
MAKFKMGVTVPTDSVVTARVGTTGTKLVDNDKGKFLKLVGDSQYDLCAVGDPIEGVLASLESATQDGYAIGGVQLKGRVKAVCDGLQATPGTGTIAVGDYVVCGTVTAAGTALSVGPKVVKATEQPGGTLADLAAAATVDAMLAKGAWRVVSVGSDGSVGDTCIIERV